MAINVDGGASKYFTADYSAAIENATDQLSFGCWVKHDSTKAWAKILIRETTGGAKEFYILYHDGSGNLRGFVRNSSDSPVAVTDSITPSNGVWYHVCVTYDGATVRLYRNGTQQDSIALTGNVKNNSAASIAIGYDPSSGTDSLDGSLRDVFVEKRALSANEVYALANGQVYVPTSSTLIYYPCDEPSGTLVDRGPNKQSTSVTGSLTYEPQGDPYQLYWGGVSFVEYSTGAAPSAYAFGFTANPPVLYGWGI